MPNPDAAASRSIVIDALYQREASPEIAERNEFDALGVHWCSSKKDRYYYAEGFHFLQVQFVAEDVFSGQPKAEI